MLQKIAIIIALVMFSSYASAQRSNTYELMERLLSKKQAELNNALEACYKIMEIPIDHLDAKDENYNVKELQRYYRESANNIAEAIKRDKANATAYFDQIRNLYIDRSQDENIKKIESSYQARKKFFEDYHTLRISDPEKFSKLLKDADDKWSGNSINKIWSAY